MNCKPCSDMDSTVGILTYSGLQGLEINYRCLRDFLHPLRPTQEPNLPPTRVAPRLLRE
jgi:hypothetical protein